MGLLLAAVVERSGSLWPAIIVHGVFNSLMTITYYTALASGAGF
jgi:membrane protease YdiL (CAAX protease family)